MVSASASGVAGTARSDAVEPPLDRRDGQATTRAVRIGTAMVQMTPVEIVPSAGAGTTEPQDSSDA